MPRYSEFGTRVDAMFARRPSISTSPLARRRRLLHLDRGQSSPPPHVLDGPGHFNKQISVLQGSFF